MRATKQDLEKALERANEALDRLGHCDRHGQALRLGYDKDPQGVRLYWHNPASPNIFEGYVKGMGGRQRIGLVVSWVSAYSRGLWVALEQKERDPLTRRLRQVVDMTPEEYVESTRPRVELPEVPWSRPANAQAAQLAALKKIGRAVCDPTYQK